MTATEPDDGPVGEIPPSLEARAIVQGAVNKVIAVTIERDDYAARLARVGVANLDLLAEVERLTARLRAVEALADGPDHRMVLSAGPERSEVRMDGSSPYGLRYTGEPGAFALVYQRPDEADRLRLSLVAQPHVSVRALRAALSTTTEGNDRG